MFTLDQAIGGDDILDSVKSWIAENPMIVLALIVALTIVVIYFLFWKAKESFNPTQNLRDQDSDQFGRKEGMTQPGRAQSAFAQQVQSAKVNAADCAGAGAVDNSPDAAWSWLNGVAHENFSNGEKPTTDAGFSKILAGH
jgi:hypothetical protein